MCRRQIFRLINNAVVFISFGLFTAPANSVAQVHAQSELTNTQSGPRQIRIHEVGSVKARADTAYLLMTVQTERSQLAQAIRDNEKQLQDFITALAQSGVSKQSLAVRNFVVTPVRYGKGFNLARNLVITVEHMDSKPPGEFAQLMAEVQDIGARFGSDCVTCIGSG